MKKMLMLCGLLFFIVISSEAKIRRVGYFGVAVPNTDYGSFALAMTAASNNDTILIFPGSVATGTVNKKVYIIGTGNWLDPASNPKGNANQQAFASSAFGSTLSFLAASDGSVVMGLNFVGNTIFVGANNITIRRNREVIVNLAYNPNTNVNVPQTINNLQLLENYKLAIGYSYNVAGFIQNNLNVSNNFMESFNLSTTLNTYNGNISNNIWAYDNTQNTGGLNGGSTSMSTNQQIYLGNGAFLFQNNILASLNGATLPNNYNSFIFNDAGNTVFNYNIITQSYNNIGIGSGTGNVVVPFSSISAIFEDFPLIGTNSADGRYRLKANSPALVANRPGSTLDAGMYSGNSPYKLSTMPSIPSIYSLSSPQGNNPSGNSIQINVSTKGNN